MDLLIDQVVFVLQHVDPQTACTMLRACPARPDAFMPMGAPLGGQERSGAAAAPLIKMAVRAHCERAMAARGMGGGGAANDQCEVCQIVVMEAAALLQDPQNQAAAVAVAKSACAAMGGAVEQQCDDAVDTYAPVVFNVALMYLKPRPLCEEVGMCVPSPPAPPAAH